MASEKNYFTLALEERGQKALSEAIALKAARAREIEGRKGCHTCELSDGRCQLYIAAKSMQSFLMSSLVFPMPCGGNEYIRKAKLREDPQDMNATNPLFADDDLNDDSF